MDVCFVDYRYFCDCEVESEIYVVSAYTDDRVEDSNKIKTVILSFQSVEITTKEVVS